MHALEADRKDRPVGEKDRCQGVGGAELDLSAHSKLLFTAENK